MQVLTKIIQKQQQANHVLKSSIQSYFICPNQIQSINSAANKLIQQPKNISNQDILTSPQTIITIYDEKQHQNSLKLPKKPLYIVTNSQQQSTFLQSFKNGSAKNLKYLKDIKRIGAIKTQASTNLFKDNIKHENVSNNHHGVIKYKKKQKTNNRGNSIKTETNCETNLYKKVRLSPLSNKSKAKLKDLYHQKQQLRQKLEHLDYLIRKHRNKNNTKVQTAQKNEEEQQQMNMEICRSKKAVEFIERINKEAKDRRSRYHNRQSRKLQNQLKQIHKTNHNHSIIHPI